MRPLATITQENNCLMVSGALDFTTVITLWEESLLLLANQNKITINLSRVSSANSAGLVLLLEWWKYAKNNQKKINFEAVPSQLMSVATVVNIDGLLKSNGQCKKNQLARPV